GVGVEIPNPLSSQTNNTGSGTCWYAAQQVELMAPWAVEWLAEASPKLHSTIASCGHWPPTPRRLLKSTAKAAPTALGNCDAMVLVCGGIFSAKLPSTLCRPPEMGSSLLAQNDSNISYNGVLPGNCLLRSIKNAPLR